MFFGRCFARTAAMTADLGEVVSPVTAVFAAAGNVAIKVTGNITPKLACTVGCNAPSRYAMQSDNTAMRLGGMRAAAPRDQIEPASHGHVRIPLTLEDTIDASRKKRAIAREFKDLSQKIAVNKRSMAQIICLELSNRAGGWRVRSPASGIRKHRGLE